jgi:hypothetical protein
VPLEHELAVAALQREADPAHEHPEDDRKQEEQDSEHPRDLVDRQVEVRGEDVVRAGRDKQGELRQDDDTDGGAGGHVARTVEHVVLAAVAGDPLLEERVDRQHREQDARHDDTRDEDVEGDREAPDDDLGLPRHETERALEEQHVPVGLRAGADR